MQRNKLVKAAAISGNT